VGDYPYLPGDWSGTPSYVNGVSHYTNTLDRVGSLQPGDPDLVVECHGGDRDQLPGAGRSIRCRGGSSSLGRDGLQTYDPVTRTRSAHIDFLALPGGGRGCRTRRGTRLPSAQLSINANMVYFPPNQKLYYFIGSTVFEVTRRPQQLGDVEGGAAGFGERHAADARQETGYAYDTVNHLIGGGYYNGVFYVFDPLTRVWNGQDGAGPAGAYAELPHDRLRARRQRVPSWSRPAAGTVAYRYARAAVPSALDALSDAARDASANTPRARPSCTRPKRHRPRQPSHRCSPVERSASLVLCGRSTGLRVCDSCLFGMDLMPGLRQTNAAPRHPHSERLPKNANHSAARLELPIRPAPGGACTNRCPRAAHALRCVLLLIASTATLADSPNLRFTGLVANTALASGSVSTAPLATTADASTAFFARHEANDADPQSRIGESRRQHGDRPRRVFAASVPAEFPAGQAALRSAEYSGLSYDVKRHRLVHFGGGHAATNYNAVNTFSLDTLAWTGAYPPTPLADMLPANYDFARGAWLTGSDAGPYPRPAARHSLGEQVVVGDEYIVLAQVEGNYPALPGDWSGTPSYSNGPAHYTNALGLVAHYNLVTRTWSWGNATAYGAYASRRMRSTPSQGDHRARAQWPAIVRSGDANAHQAHRFPDDGRLEERADRSGGRRRVDAVEHQRAHGVLPAEPEAVLLHRIDGPSR
jgi:hypothetical protein